MTWPTTAGRAQRGTFQNKVDGQLVFNAQSSMPVMSSRILTQSNIRRNFFMNSSGKKEKQNKNVFKAFLKSKIIPKSHPQPQSQHYCATLGMEDGQEHCTVQETERFTRQLYNLGNGKMNKTTVQHEKWKAGQENRTVPHEKWKDGQDHCTTLEMERWTRQLYSLGNGKMDKTTIQLTTWKDGQDHGTT